MVPGEHGDWEIPVVAVVVRALNQAPEGVGEDHTLECIVHNRSKIHVALDFCRRHRIRGTRFCHDDCIANLARATFQNPGHFEERVG